MSANDRRDAPAPQAGPDRQAAPPQHASGRRIDCAARADTAHAGTTHSTRGPGRERVPDETP